MILMGLVSMVLFLGLPKLVENSKFTLVPPITFPYSFIPPRIFNPLYQYEIYL